MKKRFTSAIAALLAMVLVLTLACPLSAAAEGTGTSVELKMNAQGVNGSVKLCVDAVNAALALAVQAKINGFDMDATLYTDGILLALTSDTFLDKAYGVDVSKALTNLPHSVLAPDSGSAFALDQETYYEMMGQLYAGSYGAMSVASVAPAVGEVLGKYITLFAENVESKATTETSFETIKVNGQDVRAMVNALVLDSQAVSQLVSYLLAEAANDQELKVAVAQMMEQLGVAEQMGITGEEFAAELWANVDMLDDEATAAILESQVKASLKMYTQGANTVAVGAELSLYGDPLCVRLVMGDPDLNPGSEIALEVCTGNEVLARAALTVMDVSSSNFSGMFSVYEGSERVVAVMLNLNKAAGTYVINVMDNYNPLVLTGRLISSGSTATITLDTVNGEPLGELSLSFNTADESVTVPKFTDILTMSNAEAEDLAMRIVAIADTMGLA